MTDPLPRRPMIIGHRGARAELPENTLEGIRHAFSMGCDMVEIDVRLTSDGEVVVVHDAALNPDLTRTVEGTWIESNLEISKLTASGLSGYDIGRVRPDSSTERRFPDQSALRSSHIPTLSEALALARENGGRLLIELKNDPGTDPDGQAAALLSARAAANVEAEGVEDRVVFQSFDWRSLRHLHDRMTDTELCALSCNKDGDAPGNVFQDSRWLDGHAEIALARGVPAAVAVTGCDYWAPSAADIDACDLRNAKGLGLRVLVWTVNAPAKIDQMLDMDVFGIITDVPTLALSRRRARRNPAFRG